MTGIDTFNRAVDYIESRLDREIDLNELSRLARMSVYEFRRIFSFVAGIPVSEYIRRRRLSVAAAELKTGTCSVTELAGKYGYETPSSFSRAFKEFHGVTPSEAGKAETPLRSYTRIGFDLKVSGGQEIEYYFLEEESFFLRGFRGYSDVTDTECCESVWQGYTQWAEDHPQSGADGKIYAAYRNGAEGVDCTVGIRADGGITEIPPSRWVCFPLRGTEDGAVNEFYNTLLFGWLPSMGYRRREDIPNLEVYPENMDEDGFLWEIRIPLADMGETR